MPNRILRDWTDSLPMNTLSWQEEVLFTRLIMKADDFGNFNRNASLVKSLLFPRKDDLRSNDVDRWLKNLEAAGLILTYPAKGDFFLHIRNFGQRLDKRSRKFPPEPENCDDNIFPEIPGNAITETKGNESETETKGETRAREEILNFCLKKFSTYWPAENAKLNREREDVIAWKDDLKTKINGDTVKLETLKSNYESRVNGIQIKKQKIAAAAVEKFWNHYEKQDWKTSANLAMTNKLAGFKSWMSKEKQFMK